MKEQARDRLARFLKKQGISNQNLIESLIGRIDCLFQENVEGKIKTKENKNVIKQWEEFEFLLLKNPAIKEILVVTGSKSYKFKLDSILKMFNEMIAIYRGSEEYFAQPSHVETNGHVYFMGRMRGQFQKFVDIPELEMTNGIKEMSIIVSSLVVDGSISPKKNIRAHSNRQKNILTYEILEAAGILKSKDSTDAKNAFIIKHL